MLHRVALVRTNVSEELSTSFITVTRIDELGTMLAVTTNDQPTHTMESEYFSITSRLKDNTQMDPRQIR
jgi:hypothetical protein